MEELMVRLHCMYGAIVLLAGTFVIVNILIKKLSDRVLVWKNEGAI